MAWFLNGNWDCLTTPPGASVNDLPLIMEQIARAINERKTAVGDTKINWYYTDALSATAEFPTAAQFAGVRVDGACVRRFLLDAKEFAENGTGWYTSAAFTTEYGSSLWTTAGAGLDAFNINKSATYAPNWLRIQRAINLMRWKTRAAVSDRTQLFKHFTGWNTTAYPTDTEAWDNRLDGMGGDVSIIPTERTVWKAIEYDPIDDEYFVNWLYRQDVPDIYGTSSFTGTCLGMRLSAQRPSPIALVLPAIAGTAEMSVNGTPVSGWIGFADPYAFHFETNTSYTVSIGFTDGDDAIPDYDTYGSNGSYIKHGGHAFLIDVQPALTIA